MIKKNKRHQVFYIFTLVIWIFLMISCKSIKKGNTKMDDSIVYVDEKTIDIDISLGKIDKYVDFEKKLNSEDVTRNYFVEISEEIYPYIKNHAFEIPKEYKFSPETSIELNKSYYYTKDGSVKLILYEWNIGNIRDVDNRKFKSIFMKLEKRITEKIGQYSYRMIESEEIKTDETYRDDIKWESPELNAYMFRFGDRNNNFNQIRLAIIKTRKF